MELKTTANMKFEYHKSGEKERHSSGILHRKKKGVEAVKWKKTSVHTRNKENNKMVNRTYRYTVGVCVSV